MFAHPSNEFVTFSRTASRTGEQIGGNLGRRGVPETGRLACSIVDNRVKRLGKDHICAPVCWSQSQALGSFDGIVNIDACESGSSDGGDLGGGKRAGDGVAQRSHPQLVEERWKSARLKEGSSLIRLREAVVRGPAANEIRPLNIGNRAVPLSDYERIGFKKGEDARD
jgi:hypothetical protein